MKKIGLFSVAAVVLALAAGSARADLVVNISGTAQFQNASDEYTGTTDAKSLNEKYVYTLISNAVANASGYTNIPEPIQHLPTNGVLMFNPTGSDGGNTNTVGYFYVTNKTGFYFQLSGIGTNDEYYSYLELDAYDYYGDVGSALYLGFCQHFNGIAKYKINSTNGNGSSMGKTTALLYFHDYPYDYDDPDKPYVFFDYNENAFEIRGMLTATFALKDFTISKESISLSGTGNIFLYDYDFYGCVSSANARF